MKLSFANLGNVLIKSCANLFLGKYLDENVNSLLGKGLDENESDNCKFRKRLDKNENVDC